MLCAHTFRSCIAIVTALSGAQALVDLTDVYTGGFNSSDTEVLLRIATGGAGQSVLADAFIQESTQNGSKPFSIGWVLSDTTFTIKNLQTGDADLGNSYVPAAEKVAADQGFIDSNIYYLFRDHFIVTGPPENPAKINDTFFAGWAVGPHGQAVITGFKKNGQQLYSGAP